MQYVPENFTGCLAESNYINQITKAVWKNGIELWDCTDKTNMNCVLTQQSKVTRGIVSAPWFVRNEGIYKDLKLETVLSDVKRFTQKYSTRLQQHNNMEM